MIKHLIFDFGGVFLDLGGKHTRNPEHLAKIFNISEEDALRFWDENRVDLLIGKETPKSFLNKMSQAFEVSVDINEAHEQWVAFFKKKKSMINWDLVEYVELLKDKYQIHMLTDVIDLDDDKSDWFDNVMKLFDNIYRSFEIGHRKPNKEAFLHVLEKINAKPEECVFIDDLQVNVDAANELGIKGILYTNLSQLKKELAILGI